LGNGLFHTVGPSHSIPAKTYGFEVVMGLGFGMIFSTTTVLIKLHAEREDAGTFDILFNILLNYLENTIN
jgi:hypothetical protein